MSNLSISERKQSAIENIVDLLKPNSYLDGTVQWEILEKALSKMTLEGLNALWTLMTCVRKHKKVKPILDYLYIRAWCKAMGSFDYYIKEQVNLAREEKAPQTAIYKDPESGDWRTFDEVTNETMVTEVKKIVKVLETEVHNATTI